MATALLVSLKSCQSQLKSLFKVLHFQCCQTGLLIAKWATFWDAELLNFDCNLWLLGYYEMVWFATFREPSCYFWWVWSGKTAGHGLILECPPKRVAILGWSAFSTSGLILMSHANRRIACHGSRALCTYGLILESLAVNRELKKLQLTKRWEKG